MIWTQTVNPFGRAPCSIQRPSSHSSITPRDWVYYSAQRGFRPEKPCQMESILILNANTADTLIAGALLSGATTQPSWWVENFRERSLNKQRLPVRMCHVHSQVHGWTFDRFTGNLFFARLTVLQTLLCSGFGNKKRNSSKDVKDIISVK